MRLVQLFDGRNATRRPETGQGLPPTRNASKAVRAASRVASYFVGGRDGQCAVWSIDDLRARLALSAALPVMCEWADNARSGCLLGYGPNRDELRRRIAHYVARIFRGSTPNELPIEGPTHFELAVNLKTAKQLGLDVPASLLAQADEVIE